MAIKTTIQLRRDTLSAWLANNPVLANGEVAIIDKNNGVGEKLWVIRIGDGVHTFSELPETAYALSADVSNLGDGVLSSAKEYTDAVSALLSADYAKQVSDEKTERETAFTTLSNALTAEADTRATADTTLSNALTAEADAREKFDVELSSVLSGKVRIENEPVDYINISKVDAETYHQMVVDGTLDDQTVYIVSSDNINAFGERVINVGDAVDLSDAVNLKQLNAVESNLTTTISSISSDLADKIEELSGASSGLIEQVSSDITSMVSGISSDLTGQIDTAKTDLTGVINTVSSDLTGRIDTVSGVVDTLSGDLYALSGEVGDLQNSLTAYDVSISALGREGDKFSYQISQGGVEKGIIEVPYDVFVDGGSIQKIDDKTWLFLTLNNEASTVLSIEATDLVDIYTPVNKTVAEGGTVSVEISNFTVAAEVLDGSITAAKLSADSVTTAKIVDDAVTTDKIADSNVTTDKIADSNVTTAKLADGAITPDKMTDLSVFVFDCGGASAE